jgi:hypothetical protein
VRLVFPVFGLLADLDAILPNTGRLDVRRQGRQRERGCAAPKDGVSRADGGCVPSCIKTLRPLTDCCTLPNVRAVSPLGLDRRDERFETWKNHRNI